jgi:hypothetical protein
MSSPILITDSIIIRNHTIWQNDKVLFEATPNLLASEFLSEAYRYFSPGYAKFFKMDRLCRLGFLASELLLHGKDLTNMYPPESLGVILSNRSSSLDTDGNHQRTINNRESYFPSPSVFVYTLANIVIGEICIRHKFLGENAFFIEEQFPAGRLYEHAMTLFAEGAMQGCLVGWIEWEEESYEGMLCLVEKKSGLSKGIAIFEPAKLRDIYLSR